MRITCAAVLLDELEVALGELPAEQREVFLAHEMEGRSFKELSAESGVSVNTLFSRKRYAVLHLRERFKPIMTRFGRNEEQAMRKKWRCFDYPPAIVLVGWIFGEIDDASVELASATAVRLHMVGFWQALGLLLLSRILFGGWAAAAANGERGDAGQSGTR